MKKKLYSILLLLSYVSLLSAFDFTVNGYQKYLFSSWNSPLTEKYVNKHILHGRLNTKWFLTENLTAITEARFRINYTNNKSNFNIFSSELSPTNDYINLKKEFDDNNNFSGQVEFDRLYLDYSFNNLQISVGRQRIAWGTALVWNVMDIFNPKSVLDFDYEEMPGSDAVRIQYYTGAVSGMEIAFKPGKSEYSTVFAALCNLNFNGYDYYIIAGKRYSRYLLAGGWSGDVKGGGFRGEFLITQPMTKGIQPETSMTDLFGNSLYEYNSTVFSLVLSADYTFANSLYVHTELLFNNNGKKENAGIFTEQAFSVGMLSPSRLSLYQEFSYNLTPLTTTGFFIIYNPTDRSYIAVPNITKSIITDLDMTLLYLYANGKNYSEFGELGSLFFFRLKYSF